MSARRRNVILMPIPESEKGTDAMHGTCCCRTRFTTRVPRVVWCCVALGWVLPTLLLAEEVAVQRSDLFVARQDGYHTYRIPGMVMTLDGTLLAYATVRDADIWDYGNYDTVLRRSTDGGKTWSPMEVLLDGGKSTVDNCVLIVDQKREGIVHHVYCVDYAHLLPSQHGPRADVLGGH